MKSSRKVNIDGYYTIIKDNIPEMSIGFSAWSLVITHVSDSFQYHKIFLGIIDRLEKEHRENVEVIFNKSLNMLINDFYDGLDGGSDTEINNALIGLMKYGTPNGQEIAFILHDITSNATIYAFEELEKNIPEPNAFKYMVSDMITLLLGLLCFKNNILIPAGSAALHIFSKNYNKLLYIGDADFDWLIESKISTKNKEKADNRWSRHNRTRPKKKKQYLEIMDQQNFTTFAETAEYIKQNIETDKTPSYDTIKRWLSQARKGDFS
ncbi:hypothetical protein ACT3QR_10885 [Psychrobacter sp. AOP7-B1-25]|uniref:hypothetical protein n=1 Tax=Psychrobacter sp. AOP7-B1-25 TaxID=3457644 RepID=UPI00402B8A8F